MLTLLIHAFKWFTLLEVIGGYWWWPEDNGNKNVTSGWWNAALYNHNTGQPYPAFYELKNFLNSTYISSVELSAQDDNTWYTLDGKRLIDVPSKKGLYIHKGKKVLF